jgi:hypothetical protein
MIEDVRQEECLGIAVAWNIISEAGVICRLTTYLDGDIGSKGKPVTLRC